MSSAWVVDGAVGCEHGAHHLEYREIESGLEIVRQVRFHERGADSAKIVAQADADACFLPGLRARIGWRGQRPGYGRRFDACRVH